MVTITNYYYFHVSWPTPTSQQTHNVKVNMENYKYFFLHLQLKDYLDKVSKIPL